MRNPRKTKGRPAVPETMKRGEHVAARISRGMRLALERAAKLNDRTVSAEVSDRLEKSFEEDVL